MLRRLRESHRARVRALWASAAGAAIVAVVLLIVFVRNTGTSTWTPPVKHIKIERPPKTVPASAAARRAAEATLATFVRSAVIRRHLAASWPLATPNMKIGTSHSDWLHGFLPVTPYPASSFRGAGFRLTYSYQGILGYDVLILPKPGRAGAAGGQQVYSCELHLLHGRWLVDSCYPRKTL